MVTLPAVALMAAPSPQLTAFTMLAPAPNVRSPALWITGSNATTDAPSSTTLSNSSVPPLTNFTIGALSKSLSRVMRANVPAPA